METQVILVGIGGGSSAGKTTLTAQLNAVIPDCVTLHQDDFWTSPEETPIHPVHNIVDLENPPTAIHWPEFREAFKRFRSTEPLQDTHPDLGQAGSPSAIFDGKISDDSLEEWRSKFQQVKQERMGQGIKIEWRLVEGFLLYYEPEITKDLDLSIFLRSPGHILQRRRQGRQYVHSDGRVWTDPPKQWDLISYPAYIQGHVHLFHGGDVESGTPIESFNLLMLEGEGTEQNKSFEDFFITAASAILRVS